MKKFICSVCGYVYEGEEAPEKCPQCGAPKDKMCIRDSPDAALHDFHQRRAELLWEAGADVLLFETQPSLGEAKIEAAIAERLGADYWISFSCKDEMCIRDRS